MKLGINRGDVIIVHSSLSRMGWTIGGPVAVIDALMSVVSNDGTIVMPTHTSSNTDPKDWVNPPVPKAWHDLIRSSYPPYQAELTPTSGVGVIPEVFRKFPKVVRSDHPNVSFAAWGKEGVNITNSQVLEYGLGKDSPLDKIYNLDGKILLLGVGYDSNTSLHLAEETANFPSKKTIRQSSAVLREGNRVRVEWEELDYDADDFNKIGEAFDNSANQNYLRKGEIGNANSLLIEQRKLVDYAVGWMEEYRK
ncbi:MAG: AAC(3) family N-acetyltransferase [Candidatus Heimdallarchaeota archaeon]|nr:AAC(3) family N-acetyltransferase [Candidatus Heimdallarchaeota archaeon]